MLKLDSGNSVQAKIRREVQRLASKHQVNTELHQTLGELEIYGDIKEIVVVSDGHGFDVEVFINGKIIDNSYVEGG